MQILNSSGGVLKSIYGASVIRLDFYVKISIIGYITVRTPLINDSGNVKEMSSTQVDEIVDQVVYQYSLNPSA